MEEQVHKLFWKLLKSSKKIIGIKNGEVLFTNDISLYWTTYSSLDKNKFLSVKNIFPVKVKGCDNLNPLENTLLQFCIKTPINTYIIHLKDNYKEALKLLNDLLKDYELRCLEWYNRNF